MASLKSRTSEATLDAFVLQHLEQRGFAGAASALRGELDQPPQPIAEASRPALASLLLSTMRLKELYEGLRDWVQVSLDTYRPELRALLFPFFVHCYLELVQGSDLEQAASLLRDCREEHAVFHRAELNLLSQVTAPSHLATHEFAKRVRGRRFEVSLSAQSRVLLLHYLQQASCTPLLQILNEHITLRVDRIAPTPASSDAPDQHAHTDGSASNSAGGADAQAAASAAAQMWVGMGAAAVSEANSEVVQWGPPKAILDKHEEIATALGIPNPNAAAAPAEVDGGGGGEGGAEESEATKGGRGRGRGRGRGGGRAGGRAGGGRDGGANGAETVSLTEPVTDVRLPLPPLSEKVEKDFLRDARKRVSLDARTPPSAALVTWVDAAGDLCSAAFSHDGSLVACGFSDGVVRLALLKEAPQALPPKKKKKAAAAAAAAADAAAAPAAAEAVAPAAADPAAAVADAAAPAADRPGGAGWGTSVSVSALADESGVPDGSARHLAVFRGHSGPVYGVSFSRDDHYLLSGSQDGSARLWGIVQRACLVRYAAHSSPVWSVAFAPVGPYFATCGYDRSLRVWRVDSTQPIRLLCGHLADVRCCAFHPNPSLIASGSDDACIRVWDVLEAKCVRMLCHHGHASAVSCLDISPDGLLLASGGDDRSLLLWHLPSARLCARIAAHSTPLWCVSFSADGAHLATTASDCSLAVWDAKAAAAAASGGSAASAPTAAGAASSGGNGDASMAPAASGSAASEQPHLIVRLHTKHTPVVRAQYTRTNLLLATGSFSPPPKPREKKASI